MIHSCLCLVGWLVQQHGPQTRVIYYLRISSHSATIFTTACHIRPIMWRSKLAYLCSVLRGAYSYLSMFCSAGWFENWGESWRICSAGLILNLQTQHNRQRVHNFTRNVHQQPQPAMVGNRVSRFKWFKSVSSLFVINSLIEHVLSP